MTEQSERPGKQMISGGNQMTYESEARRDLVSHGQQMTEEAERPGRVMISHG